MFDVLYLGILHSVLNTDGRRLDGRHFTRMNRYSPAVAQASGSIAELDYVLCSSGGRCKCHTNLLICDLATLVYGDVTDGFVPRSFASASKLRDYTARTIETEKMPMPCKTMNEWTAFGSI